MLSIVIPAHNEAQYLGATLAALASAVKEAVIDVDHEIVVVDDGSTDATAEIARAAGARVVSVDVRQIAASRNAGARAARGDMLVFVDADTIVPASVLRAAVAAMQAGAVGGGARAVYNAGTPPWAQRAIGLVSWFMAQVSWAAGCFVFAQREPFERAGGFDERYFASEEIHLSRAMKRQGRFVIIPEFVVTSGRKAEVYSAWDTLRLGTRMLWPGTLKRRDRLHFWYRRHDKS